MNKVSVIEELVQSQLDFIKECERKLKDFEDNDQQHFKEYFDLKLTLKMARESIEGPSVKIIVKRITREDKLKDILQ